MTFFKWLRLCGILIWLSVFGKILGNVSNETNITKEQKNRIEKKQSNLEIVSISENEVVLDFYLPDFEIINSDVSGYQKILLHSLPFSAQGEQAAFYTTKEGFPRLPFFSEIFGVPPSGYITAVVSNIKTREIHGVNIEPAFSVEVYRKEPILWDNQSSRLAQYMPEESIDVEYTMLPDKRYYTQGNNYPEEIIKTGEPAFAGFQKIQSFNFYPFRTNTQKKTLSVIETARITIYIHGEKPIRNQNIKIDETSSFSTDLLFNRATTISELNSKLLVNHAFSRHWQMENSARIDPKTHNSQYSDPFLVSEIQLRVTESGLYKVTYEELKTKMQEMQSELGIIFSWHIDQINPKHLELVNKGKSIPIHFVGENDGSFDHGDYFEFWGERLHGSSLSPTTQENNDAPYYHPYTDKNVYILRLLNKAGNRMALEDGGLREINLSIINKPDAFDQTVHFERQLVANRLSNQISQNNYSFYREDVLFWKAINAPAMDRTPFVLEYPINSNTRHFNAKLSLWGLTYTNTSSLDHHARVWINTALIAEHRWSKQNEQIFENINPLGNFHLFHGANDLFIDLSGDTTMGDREQVLLDYFTLTYWREYKTDTNFLKFNKPSNSPIGIYQFELHNFTDDDVYVYKLGTSVLTNLTIQPLSDLDIPPFTIKFQTYINSEGVEFAALAENMKKKVHSFAPDYPSDLKNPFQQAEYLIITNRDFLQSEGALLFQQIWQSRGVNTKIVDVQDIYDEFNHGIVSPYAIKEFFKYAYLNWTEPRFNHVLLLGGGIFDKRSQADIDMFDIIPIYNIWTYRNGATPSDNWYACIIGDDPVPDFHISRISVFEANQILPIAQKSQHYLENRNFHDKWHSNVTLVGGGKIDDSTDIFAQQNERIRKHSIPRHYQANRVYTTVTLESPLYLGRTFELLGRINDGTTYVQFLGHGGGRIWADYNLLVMNDVRTLRNTNYPFISSLSCFAASFETRGISSIGEVFISEPNKGAIAHFGFSGLGLITQIEDSGNYLADAFFNKNINSFGAIATYHKIRFYSRYSEHQESWLAHVHGGILMGDPMLYHFKPEIAGTINIQEDKYLIAKGDTLSINVQFDPDITEASCLILNELEIPINHPANIPVVQGKFEYDFIIPPNIAEGRKEIKVIGSGPTRAVVALSSFAIGNSIFVENEVIPNTPTENDFLKFRVKVFTNDVINDMNVFINYLNYDEKFPMTYNETSGFWESENIEKISAGTMVNYKFAYTISNQEGLDMVSSETFLFRILAADLALLNMSLREKDNVPGFDVLIQNTGDITSKQSSLILKNGELIFNSVSITELEPDQSIWQFISIPENLQNVIVTAVVNDFGKDFSEYNMLNNVLSHHLNHYFFKAGVLEKSVASFDNNLEIFVPKGFISQEAWFSLNSKEYISPYLQPDVKPIALLNGDFSTIYNIDILDKNLLADTLGTFAENKRIVLCFNIENDVDDSLNKPKSIVRNNTDESIETIAVYRWSKDTKKWIYQGGHLARNDKKIIYEIKQTGIYTVLRNMDNSLPQIELNVDGQKLVYGSFISGKSVLSFIFSDDNGIDLVEQNISITLNNESVDSMQLTLPKSPENTNNIPVKYQLSLTKGDYFIEASCWDVNGNKNIQEFHFKVNDNFDLIRIANYPNPVRNATLDPMNAGRTRFTYTLTDNADSVNLKIYTVSGRLVKTFRNLPSHVGYHEFPRTVYAWDCKDEEGFSLANGVYFYRITARKNNKEISKTNRLAILK